MKLMVIACALVFAAPVLAVACNGGGGEAPAPSPAATATASPATTASPSPAATATAPPAGSMGEGQIAYVGPDGADVWLINADGSGNRRLTQGQCPQAPRIFWSPRGDKIACVSIQAPEAKLTVVDLEGRIMLELEHKAELGYFAWSGNNHNFVYTIGEPGSVWTASATLVIADTESGATVGLDDAQNARWSPDGGQLAYVKVVGEELTIYDLASGQARPLRRGLRPLAWALGGEALVVAAGFRVECDGECDAYYEVNLLDLASGEMTRLPELDNGSQFWLTPDGQAATFLAGSSERPEGGLTIAILDLATHKVTSMEGAAFGFPGSEIPPDHIAFSADGAYLHWVDVVFRQSGPSGTIYRARSDGSGLTQLATAEGSVFVFSPDRTRMLYSPDRDRQSLWVAGVDGSDAQLLVEGIRADWSRAAWRPPPTP
jgi:hypothetical protein